MVIDTRTADYLTQDLLEEYMAARNAVDEAQERLTGLESQILTYVLQGVPVEPGIHTASIRWKRKKGGGHSLKVKLKVR